METLTLKSNLDGFILLDSIDSLKEHRISGTKYFADQTPLFCMTESMAQLGAMHFRWLIAFQRHVFFLKAGQLSFRIKNIDKGYYSLDSKPEGRSEKTLACRIAVRNAYNALTAEGVFLFSSLSYDLAFRKEKLKSHYLRIFSCLQTNTGND